MWVGPRECFSSQGLLPLHPPLLHLSRQGSVTRLQYLTCCDPPPPRVLRTNAPATTCFRVIFSACLIFINPVHYFPQISNLNLQNCPAFRLGMLTRVRCLTRCAPPLPLQRKLKCLINGAALAQWMKTEAPHGLRWTSTGLCSVLAGSAGSGGSGARDSPRKVAFDKSCNQVNMFNLKPSQGLLLASMELNA